MANPLDYPLLDLDALPIPAANPLPIQGTDPLPHPATEKSSAQNPECEQECAAVEARADPESSTSEDVPDWDEGAEVNSTGGSPTAEEIQWVVDRLTHPSTG